MKTGMLLSLVVFAGALAIASPGYPGALVAQPNSPSFSGEGKPEDWDGPSLAPPGRPSDWDSPGLTTYGRPTDWGSMYKPSGKPDDWGSPYGGYVSIWGRPTDWESPKRFGGPRLTPDGKPTHWDSPFSLVNPWAFLFQSLTSLGRTF